jgi:hypothetical protein
MAWQVLLVRLPDALSTLAALPVDYVAPSLGNADSVADCIEGAATRACVTVDRFGSREDILALRTEEFVIEAELGGVASVDRVLLRVLGSDAAIPLVCALAQALGAAAVDCETDTVLDADAMVPDTLRQWQIRIDGLR